ncbi:hypothetical protein TWF173_005365 [Orbilia oligospora]|nr:hypothetical protein TWF173_005365 [Orbilia oligospora]
MLFSKFLVVLGATAASAITIPAAIKHSMKTVEKRAIEDAFRLQVQGGTLNGLWLVGNPTSTGAFDATETNGHVFSLDSGTLKSTSTGGPTVLGYDTLAWAFFDNSNSAITSCSIASGTDVLTGCVASYQDPETLDTFDYDRFSYVQQEDEEGTKYVWSMGNSGTNWVTENGNTITLKAVAV